MRRAAALLLVLVVAGCGSGSGGDGPAPVTLQVAGSPEELAAYRELVAAFGRETGQQAELIEVADRDANIQKLSTSFAADDPPDVFLINYRNFASFAARGAIDPAGPRLEASSRLDRADYFPEPMEAFEYDGVLQCMPQNVSSLVVYYNRDLFRAAGLADPAPDWTYEQFRDAGRALTEPFSEDREVRTYGVGLDPEIVRLAPFVWSAGGDLVDDPDDPRTFTLDTPEGRRGLLAFLDVQGGDRLAPFEEEVEAKPLVDRFVDGELGMFLSSRREVPTFRTIEGFEWDVAAFPRVDEPASVLHADAYCAAEGDRADAAWAFVEFAAGAEGQRILARSGRIVPSLKRVARSDAFLDPSQPPASSQLFLDAIPTVRRLPVASTWPEIEEAADLAIKRAYYTELTVEEALERLDRETAPLLERARDAGP